MRVLICGALLLLGCGDDGGNATDAGPAVADATFVGTIPTTCTGSCAEMNLTASFGATSRSFDRAFFGLTSPAMSDSGQWEVHLEANTGSDAACPTENSAVPDFVLTLAGFRAPTEVGDASAAAALFDFGGTLSGEFAEQASAHTLSWVAADLCIACAEGNESDRPERMVSFDLDATFATGTVAGHAYAKHCDSLDKI